MMGGKFVEVGWEQTLGDVKGGQPQPKNMVIHVCDLNNETLWFCHEEEIFLV